MGKLGLMWKKGISVLFALSLFLLLTSSLIGCGSSSGAADSGGGHGGGSTAAARIAAAVNTELAAADYKRGISVAVYDGTTMLTYAAGYADGLYGTATGTAMTPATPGYAYSITKTFVSALVLKQINDEGLYTLDNTVADLLVNSPNTNTDFTGLSAGQMARIRTTATVRQLLTHTSGMLNYASNLTPLVAMCNPAASWKPVDILENVVFEDLVAGSPPFAFNYSNTNYILLGMIAQQMDATHRTLSALLAANFFGPLSITADFGPLDGYPADIAHPYDDQYVLLHAGLNPYFTDFSVLVSAVYPGYDIYLGIGRGTWAAGGIVTTAANLATWGYQLYDPAGLAISSTIRTLLKASAPLDGNYGYGINYNDFTYTDGTVGGYYGHGGGAPGYRTLLIYEKNKALTVAIMTNVNNSGTGSGHIVDVYALGEAILNAY